MDNEQVFNERKKISELRVINGRTDKVFGSGFSQDQKQSKKNIDANST